MSLQSAPAAEGRLVIAKVCSCPGCTPRPDLDTPNSHAFTVNNAMTGGNDRLFFIPRPLAAGGYYTIDQVEEIERALACFGMDLLPLDHVLLN